MACRAARRARHRLGRRGAVLSLKGTMAVLYGYAQMVAPAPDTRGIRVLLWLLPAHGWAAVWIVAGLVAMASAWLRQGADRFGFAAIMLVAEPWALANLLSWGLYDNARGWIGGLIWAAFGGVAAIAAAWPEPPRPAGRRAP